MVDFSGITSLSAAHEAFLAGRLERVYLLPVNLGGTDDPRNVIYCSPGAAAAKAEFDNSLILPVRYAAKPEYRGDSFVPATIHITAGELKTTLRPWGAE